MVFQQRITHSFSNENYLNTQMKQTIFCAELKSTSHFLPQLTVSHKSRTQVQTILAVSSTNQKTDHP